jgi:deoxyxylulose-5-phosphate synthase
LFRNGEGILDLDTEVPDSAFDLGVTEQELHTTAIAIAVPSVTMAASWNRRRCSGERPNPKTAGIR